VEKGLTYRTNYFARNCPLKFVLPRSRGATLINALAQRTRAARSDPTGEWARPTVARFPDQESRDGFLRSVAASEDNVWEVKRIADDGRVAWVCWRAGHFLALNDIAHAHGGQIFVTVVQRRMM
jgi:hypothetical protein